VKLLNQSLPHYLPIEGFPYHQALHIHVLTAGNIGNVFSSAGICVLVQQTDLKRHFGESVVSCTRYNIISVANSVVLSRLQLGDSEAMTGSSLFQICFRLL
jgi:hypothetical protein